jgi:hypothetical protein
VLRLGDARSYVVPASFAIRASSLFRHADFVIRHFIPTLLPLCCLA